MRLYLIRHADAVELAEGRTMRDAERELTRKGRRQAKRLAGFLQAVGVTTPAVISSPLLRALQTAQILSRCLAAGDVTSTPALAPNGDPGDVLETVSSFEERDVLAVGHMPDLGRMAAWLLGAPEHDRFAFRKTATAAFRFEGRPTPGTAVLEWIVQPCLLKVLAPE
jgi:phosphohistidine phosphatase